jgi:hypothetical protein
MSQIFGPIRQNGHPGTVFEISNLDAEPYRTAMAALHEAARAWDGSDPVRESPL